MSSLDEGIVHHEIANRLEEIASQLRGMADGVLPDVSSSPGETLRVARSKKGMTQSQLASRAQVSVNTVMNIENDLTKPRIKTLMALAQAVGIPWQSLSQHHEDDTGSEDG